MLMEIHQPSANAQMPEFWNMIRASVGKKDNIHLFILRDSEVFFLKKGPIYFWTKIKMKVGFSLCLYCKLRKFSLCRDLQLFPSGYKISGGITWSNMEFNMKKWNFTFKPLTLKIIFLKSVNINKVKMCRILATFRQMPLLSFFVDSLRLLFSLSYSL